MKVYTRFIKRQKDKCAHHYVIASMVDTKPSKQTKIESVIFLYIAWLLLSKYLTGSVYCSRPAQYFLVLNTRKSEQGKETEVVLHVTLETFV